MISAVVLLLISVAAIPSGCEPFLFGNGCRICTVLVSVPLSSYKFYVFSILQGKVTANTDFFATNQRQAWVEAPSPGFCRPPPPLGYICTLLGFYEPVFRWHMFCRAQDKFRANSDLLRDSQIQNANFYQAWVDAPIRYCR